MKKLSIVLFTICLLFASCSNDEETSKKEDSEKLEKLYDEIIALSLSNTETCTNSDEWLFTAIGSKACGGDAAYIVYSKKTNTTEFLSKVKQYTDAQIKFNEKWSIGSDCSITVMPTGVTCLEGKATLSYNHSIF